MRSKRAVWYKSQVHHTFEKLPVCHIEVAGRTATFYPMLDSTALRIRCKPLSRNTIQALTRHVMGLLHV